MLDSLPSEPPADPDDPLAFTPVPMLRRRANGWTAERQRRFVMALEVMGAVGPAARAVGMGRASAYRLREREGAESFAEAWDIAIAVSEDRQFHAAYDLAINGVTTVRVLRGGMVDVTSGPDRRLLHAALLPPPPRFFPAVCRFLKRQRRHDKCRWPSLLSR